MAALVRVERAYAHEPVHPALGLAVAVGVGAYNPESRARHARLFSGLDILYFGLVAPALRPAHVHAHQHFRPVAALGAARAGVYCDYRVAGVVRAAQERFYFGRVEGFFQGSRFCGELCGELCVVLGFLGELEQRGEVVGALF